MQTELWELAFGGVRYFWLQPPELEVALFPERPSAAFPTEMLQGTLDEPRFSGAQDPIAALALCGAHRADRVMIAGRWRVIDGAPEGVDLEALIAKHKAAARAFA